MDPVKILSTFRVHPTNRRAERVVKLSDNDVVVPRGHMKCIYFWSKGPSDLSVLWRSLADLLSEFDDLTGTLTATPDGGFDLKTGGPSAPGVECVEAECSLAMTECKFESGVQPAGLTRDVTAADYASGPLARLQATRFADGGLSLGFAISHNLMDGWGLFRFVNAWARLATGREPLSITCDRPLLYGDPNGDVGQHPEYKIAPPKDPDAPAPQFEMPPTQAATFKLSNAVLSTLKLDSDSQLVGGRTVTVNDVATALFWQAVSRARQTPGDTPVRIGFAVNGRRRLEPPLSDSYVGNVTLYGITDEVRASDLVSMPLGEASWLVRCAVKRMNNTHIRSALNWVAAQADKSRIIPGFNAFLGFDYSSSSWTTFPMYDVDFGFGRPTYAGIPNAAWDGFQVVLPARDGDGVEVLLSLKTEQTAILVHDPILQSYVL